MDHFFCSKTYLEKKNEKKLTAKKYVTVCVLPETEDHINLFQVNFLSLYHLKISENLWFFIFLGGWKENIGLK